MSKCQIEKVENRIMLECDNFLMVNYYPANDILSNFAFISQDRLQKAKSNYTIGQWRIKSLKNKNN